MQGFDDIADGQYAVPSLTTVSFDKRQMASEALRLLTERMADRAPSSAWSPSTTASWSGTVPRLNARLDLNETVTSHCLR